jgi:Ser/Thr protein kinase RdoA (MazF antagonist)
MAGRLRSECRCAEWTTAAWTHSGCCDSLDAVGLRGDGRMLQLNSYENRVFQVFLEDGDVVVAKFYRPGRWSDAQILEEHSFALELAAAEVPVVPPLVSWWPCRVTGLSAAR